VIRFGAGRPDMRCSGVYRIWALTDVSIHPAAGMLTPPHERTRIRTFVPHTPGSTSGTPLVEW
jgi:hypothetical protein